jgi:hypothetical protein
MPAKQTSKPTTPRKRSAKPPEAKPETKPDPAAPEPRPETAPLAEDQAPAAPPETETIDADDLGAALRIAFQPATTGDPERLELLTRELADKLRAAGVTVKRVRTAAAKLPDEQAHCVDRLVNLLADDGVTA